MPAPTDRATLAVGPGTIGAGYRPHLDGLRAVAVYLVVAFHAGSDRFVGGFIGVDVFFVLSGYLVTQLLLRDLDGSGSIGFARFYARRYRRLLPAAFVTLLVTAVAYAAVASPAAVAESVGGFRASFLYYANWFFIRASTDYWGGALESSPVLHFWSLSIEEQFYLVWPLVLAGLFAATKHAGQRQRTLVRVSIAVGAMASLVYALQLADTDLNRAYFGTETRAYQLLAGALLALSPRLFRFGPEARRWLQRLVPVSLAVLVVLATSLVDLDVIERGVAVVVATAVLVVAIESAPGGATKRALSSGPAVYLGKVSYGTYLWHWPVIVIAGLVIELSPIATLAVAVLLATALASLSYELLERPVRASPVLDRLRGPVIATGLALSVVAGIVIVPALLEGEARSPAEADRGEVASGASVVPSELDWQSARDERPPLPECLDAPASECTVVEGTGRHVLLMGDSHAWMLMPTFTEIARRQSLTLSVASTQYCPWQDGVQYADASGVALERCWEHQRDWYERVVDELDPEIVVLANRPYDDPTSAVDLLGPGGEVVRYGTIEHEALVRDATRSTIGRLRDAGRDVVVVEPIPIARRGWNPIECLSQAEVLEECRYVAHEGPTPVEELYRTAVGDHVWSLDLDRLVCPYLPICDPVVGGTIVKRDYSHITAAYAAALSEDLELFLSDLGILAT